MRCLLDTHVLLWWLAGDPLSAEATRAIADPASELFVSAASLWEMSIKAGLGRLEMPEDLADVLADQSIDVLDVTGRHSFAVRHLPAHHRDPFDRMLVAQAIVERLTIVTRDDAISRYGVPIIVA